MTTSGVSGTMQVDITGLLEHAYRRCGKASAMISAEMSQAALNILFMMVNEWSNRNTLLWCNTLYVMGYVPGVFEYYLPAGTIDVLDNDINHRTNVRVSGSIVSSAGGTASYLNDGELDTSCTQVSANGNFYYDAGSGSTVTIQTVGMVSNGTASYTLAFEISSDGVSWTTLQTAAAQSYVDRTPVWTDIAAPRAARFFRVRETGGATLNVRELMLVTSFTEIPVFRSNKDQYITLPNKSFLGTPVTQIWVDRQFPLVKLHTWPAPSDFMASLSVWRRRQVMDPTDLTLSTGQNMTLEIPDRWLRAAMLNLAAEIGSELPDVDPNRLKMIKDDCAQAIALASAEERDNSPLYLTPDISRYTRF